MQVQRAKEAQAETERRKRMAAAAIESLAMQLAERDAEIARLRGSLPDDMEARAAYPKEG